MPGQLRKLYIAVCKKVIVVVILWMRLAPLLATLVTFVGCAGHSPRSFPGLPPVIRQVVVDEAFTDAEEAAIEDSLEEWNDAIGAFMRFEMVGRFPTAEWESALDRAHQSKTLVVVLRDPLGEFCDGDNTLACAEVGGNGMAFRTDVIGNHSVKAIAVHEFGHIIGSDHIMVADSVMFPSYTGIDCVDVTTLKHLATIKRFWRLEEMEATCAPSASPRHPTSSAHPAGAGESL